MRSCLLSLVYKGLQLLVIASPQGVAIHAPRTAWIAWLRLQGKLHVFR